MSNDYYLVSWDQFQSRKLITQKEIVKTEDINAAVKRLLVFNAEKRLSTTNYKYSNLTELFKAHNLKIEVADPVKEPVANEDSE